MKRSVVKAQLSDTEYRYRVTIESDECESGTFMARMLQHQLLRTVVDTPGMMDCGSSVFQTLRMSHDGMKWVVELEAIAT